MAWSGLGSIGSNLFSSGTGNFGQGSTGFDWGSLWGQIGQGATSAATSSAGNSGFWGTAANAVGNWLGSSSGQAGGGTNASNIFGAMLGGLNGVASAYMDEKTVREAGKEQRRTIEYSAALKDFYDQKDKQRKRTALDTFGQFSLMDRWAPGRTAPAALDTPSKPGL